MSPSKSQDALPPGQHEIGSLPRFGLPDYMHRFPSETKLAGLDIGGDISQPCRLSQELESLQRVDQESDFHCVTTWTKRNVRWSGYRFSEFFETLVRPKAEGDFSFVIFRAQDGYRVGLQLADLLQPDVLLADRLEGKPLPVANGAPLRLVAPAHYGYKNPKHIASINFYREEFIYRKGLSRVIDHPRARVALEERGMYFPGRFLRWLYRPMIGKTRRQFEKALQDHLAQTDQAS